MIREAEYGHRFIAYGLLDLNRVKGSILIVSYYEI